MMTGRRDLANHALQLLPTAGSAGGSTGSGAAVSKLNTPNQQGLSVLMVGCLREEFQVELLELRGFSS